jgi:small conductance mechanosensitive channel
MDRVSYYLTFYGPRILGAIIVLVAGWYLISFFSRWFTQRLKNTDASLQSFLKTAIVAALRVLLIVSVMSLIGFHMTSFIAIIGAIGLAIGLALSGTLQNFAGGVIILMLRPFKVGDFINAQGYMGSVEEIQIFNTILKTPDNRVIIIPNGGLSTSSLTNFSVHALRRVDWTFGIAYGDSYIKAKEVLKKLMENDKRIKNDPPAFIALQELGASSVNIVVRAWVDAADYWNVFFDMNEKVYDTFSREGINIPFPQMDIHIHERPAAISSEPMWVPPKQQSGIIKEGKVGSKENPE